ncbi:UNVERIFIED_CONTAM: hypothetical protein H355_008599, partial [Colinus virginianus]
MVGGDPYCCELLLHDYARLGCVDENGWQEIHQACRYGHVQHLEHLLFYGADMTAQNASGNTALHICALYNQESCARVLLFRGASKEIRNYNSQTAFQGMFWAAQGAGSSFSDASTGGQPWSHLAVVVWHIRRSPEQPVPADIPPALHGAVITLHVMDMRLLSVAIIAGNFELAEVIKTHKESDV